MRLKLFAFFSLGLIGPITAAETVDYARQIKPVLQARCYACHGVLKREAGLRLDTAKFAVKGGESGIVILPGNADESPLIRRVISADETERMPPEGEPLKPGEIAALRDWIAAGAIGPSDETPERDPREHWAFQPVVRPNVPNVAWGGKAALSHEDGLPQNRSDKTAPSDGENPIDSFIASMHQQIGLSPQPVADKRIWLRRVSLDLIGLPPTQDELDAFLADDSLEAVQTVVDRLLDSPHYGERWGRHWMDIWRYSDWWGLGEDARNSQKHIWHWRDWIVESLNADKGYDQMLREMLAADELYPDDPDRLRAGGFLARQYFKFNRTSWLDETIEHTAKSMLGLTFNCSKCHDHKYDPFPQADYYRFRAIFEPYQVRIDANNGQIDFEKDGIPRPFDCNLEAKTFIHIRGDDRNPDTSRNVEPAFPGFLSVVAPPIEPVNLPPVAIQPGLRANVVEAYLKQAEGQIVAKRVEVESAKKRLAEAERFEALSPEEKAKEKEVSTNTAGVTATTGKSPMDSPLPVDQSRLTVVIAEKALTWAELQPVLIRARAETDNVRYFHSTATNLTELARIAARSERIAVAAKADEEVSRAELELTRAATDKKAELEAKLATARTTLESAKKAIDEPGDSYTSIRGSLKALESNLETEDSRQKPFPTTSTGRRKALAQWMTDPQNPLTARVAVNHIWSRHFGRPLVPTVFDFGRKGTPPTHPALLDWLAMELVEGRHDRSTGPLWGMKHIHRLIVTSKTYSMTSTSAAAASENLTIDPDNRFYWRMNPIRMESQIVRDSLLHLAGELDVTMGGPSIPITNETSRRRSIYFVHSNIEHQKFLAMFDDASVLDCYRRAESIVPQQALALENSPLATEMAGRIAQRIEVANTGADDREFIRKAFLRVLSTESSSTEIETALEAMTRLIDLSKRTNRSDPQMYAKTSVIQALLNHNDFVTVR